MKTAGLRTFEVSGTGPGPWHAKECRLVRPLDIYPEFRQEDAEDRGRRADARRRVERIFLEIPTDGGPTGLYGPIDRRQAFLAATCLGPLLKGRFGPGSGREGLEANLALVRTLRETLGPGYGLMFDAWTSWDPPYAAAFAASAILL
jgi:hypothetical protein